MARVVAAAPRAYDPLMRRSIESSLPRRTFLEGLGGALVVAAVAPRRLLAGPTEERILSFVNTHTRERLTTPYFADGQYLPRELKTLDEWEASLK